MNAVRNPPHRYAMGTVYIEDLLPGMVLSADARSRQGRLLFSQGLILDDLSIQTLKFWGVTEAQIDGHDQATLDARRLAQLGEARANACEAEAARLLRFSDQNLPPVAELRRVVVIQMIQSGNFPGTREEQRPPPAPSPTELRKKPDLARLANGAVKLAALPSVVSQTLDALKDPNVSYGYLGAIIGKDTALSAKLLKLVNSALYSFPEPVETIERAVTVVGAGKLTSLAIGVSMISVFSDIPRDVLDMRSFWKHSLSCGVLARLLAVGAGHPNAERCFVAGLLHDIGRLTMLKGHSAHVAQAIGMAIERDVPLCLVEKELWGFDHAELGGRLLRSWRFPPSLEHAVAAHHAYQPATDNQDAALVHAADILAHALRMGASGAHAAPPLSPAVWPQLNLPLSALGAAAAQAERQLDDIGHILLSGHG